MFIEQGPFAYEYLQSEDENHSPNKRLNESGSINSHQMLETSSNLRKYKVSKTTEKAV